MKKKIIYNGKKIKLKNNFNFCKDVNIFKVNRNHKDRLFIKLFNNKEALLQLYNAVNDSNYKNYEDMVITTMDDAVYLGMKNDCSFIFGSQLNLYEHQSTFCPNMPVRGLLYIAAIYEAYIADNNYNIYIHKKFELPAPQYVVFYNGEEERPDVEILRLSDSFNCKKSSLEFTAIVYNINNGYNEKIMKQCKLLNDYSEFINQIRIFQKKKCTLDEAIDKASRYCIENDILKDYLIKNRNEVRKVLLTEYDVKKHMKLERIEAREEGRMEGTIRTCQKFNLSKEETINNIMEEFSVNEEEAENIVKKYWIYSR